MHSCDNLLFNPLPASDRDVDLSLRRFDSPAPEQPKVDVGWRPGPPRSHGLRGDRLHHRSGAASWCSEHCHACPGPHLPGDRHRLCQRGTHKTINLLSEQPLKVELLRSRVQNFTCAKASDVAVFNEYSTELYLPDLQRAHGSGLQHFLATSQLKLTGRVFCFAGRAPLHL